MVNHVLFFLNEIIYEIRRTRPDIKGTAGEDTHGLTNDR